MSHNFKQYNSFEFDDEENYEVRDTKQQKIIFFAFIGFGMLALILAVFQLKFSLKAPFHESVLTLAGDANKAKLEQDIFLLQNIDTDTDGLNDYDELYIYGTSRYLADSDSDGYNDKVELDSQNNPNCPNGGNCSFFLDEGFVASSSLPVSDDMYSMMQQNFGGNEAAILRGMLIEQGIPEDLLSQISDDDLIEEYANIINSAPLESEENNSIDKENLENLTPAEIRTLLKSKGIDKGILDSIDDETLKKDFLDTLNKL